ncbi:hypothetical protein GH714_014572 [Hevea brasiliensis]|uniref:Protein kinase domain-containing protein n=1 Tax=Hevea brasiliensis TaxID=3981 RepID=A0A6A6LRS3_HEVBR|nr:hypothetical protein GH714_014572 [Hevea brasiliensis]
MSFLIAPSKEMPGASSGQFFGILNHIFNGISTNHIVAIELDTFQDQEFNDINDNHVAIGINSLVSVKSAPAGYFLNEYVEFKNLSLASGELTQVWVGYDATRNQLNITLSPIHTTLTYLNEENEIVTFHRVIKASNVLLDNELNRKLGDFGLARCSKHTHDAHIVGTLGYNAPELARSGKATTSTDVYAFGVFYLEVACGRRPVEPHASSEEMIMVNWVYECLREGKIFSTTDPKLDKKFNAEEVELVLKLGLICSHNLAEIGPNMTQVLKYLKGDAFLPENFDNRIQEQEYRGESDSHAILHGSIPSLITESLISVGR